MLEIRLPLSEFSRFIWRVQHECWVAATDQVNRPKPLICLKASPFITTQPER